MPPRKRQSIASEKLSPAYEAWTRFTSEMSAKRPASNGKEADIFKARAIDQFDPQYAVEVLSSNEPAYFGLREVLFAGFCAWIAFPGALRFIRRSMLAEALWQLQYTEQMAREKLTDRVFSDIFVRMSIIDYRFFTSIYHPLIEFSPIDRLLLRGEGVNHAAREANRTDIQIAISVLKVLHYHFTELLPNASMKASLNKAYAIAGKFGGELGGRYIASRHVLGRYQQFRPSVAFAYAASSMAVLPGNSLLDLILNQNATFEDHGHLLAELLGRTAYVRDVLGCCADKRDYLSLKGYVEGIEPISMPKITLSRDASVEAKTQFTRQVRRSTNR